MFWKKSASARDLALVYPTGFAERMLAVLRLRTYGGWSSEGLPANQIRFVPDDEETDPDDVSAVIEIDDMGIEPAWDKLRWLGTGFEPKAPVEEAVMHVVFMDIVSFCQTNYAPAPRFFTIGEVLASYSRDLPR